MSDWNKQAAPNNNLSSGTIQGHRILLEIKRAMNMLFLKNYQMVGNVIRSLKINVKLDRI